jgi:hypothetical protein
MTEKLESLKDINKQIADLRDALNDYQHDYGLVDAFDDATGFLGYALQTGIRLEKEEQENTAEVWTVSFIATPRHPAFSPGYVSHGTLKYSREDAEEQLAKVRQTWDDRHGTPIWVPFIERIG